MLKYQNVHRNILIYIYINMYKYSYNMQNGYADMLMTKYMACYLLASTHYCTHHALVCRYVTYAVCCVSVGMCIINIDT